MRPTPSGKRRIKKKKTPARKAKQTPRKRITSSDVQKVTEYRMKQMQRYPKEHPESVGPIGVEIQPGKIPSLPANLKKIFETKEFPLLFTVQLIKTGKIKKQAFLQMLEKQMRQKSLTKQFQQIKKALEKELKK